jgi:hypothetical protein
MTFTADSNYLASCGRDGLRLWPLSPEGGRQRLVDLGDQYYCYGIAADAATPTLLAAAPDVGAFLVQPNGAPPRRLEGIPPTVLHGCVLDTRAGIAAVGVNYAPDARDMVIHVADLRTGAIRRFSTRDPGSRDPGAGKVTSLGFASDGSLVAGGEGGISRWDLATGERTRIESGVKGDVALSRSGSSMIALVSGAASREVLVVDLLTGARRHITSHGDSVMAVAMDATGDRIATGDGSGVVRVGRATGEEPHLLLGHRGAVAAVALSPDGKWLASASGTEIILWPVPDLSKPPLHALPHEELLAKLRSLTNLRAVRDASSSTGWRLELGPFPGWQRVPEW